MLENIAMDRQGKPSGGVKNPSVLLNVIRAQNEYILFYEYY